MPNMKRRVAVLILALVLSLSGRAMADTYYVPDDFGTIQEAIDDPTLAAGDTIIVRDGTYYENLDFWAKPIILRSENGAATTIIDGGGLDTVVTFNADGSTSSWRGTSSTIEGFTITNGHATTWKQDGGGVFCYYSSPTIVNCIITNNAADDDGGGIGYYADCYPTIINCTISRNYAFDRAGGLYAPCIGLATVVNSIFWDNTGSNEIDTGCGTPTVNITYSDIQGGYTGTGNIGADPLFMDGGNGDFHLQPTSPCIDVGRNTVPELPDIDFEGDPRTVDGDDDGTVTVDMGVDEYGTNAIRAAFKAIPTSGQAPLEVTFTDASAGQIESWSWDFGDEGTSTEQNPSHTYTQVGSHTVSLAVSGPGGEDTVIKIDYIVTTPCRPDVTSVLPAAGLEGVNTNINISGGCFQQGATAALYGGSSVVGSCDTTDARGVYVSGNYAYVADVIRLRVIDVSDPASPFIVGSGPGLAEDVFVSGDHAYVASGSLGLRVIDVSSPANPSLVGSCDTPNYAKGVCVSGNYAYVADGSSSGLQVIDVSNPASPSIVGSCYTADYAHNVYVSGNYAYLADTYSGLQVIDITNPASPSIVGSCDTAASARGVYVSGNYAYVADHSSGLRVIDVSDPANPSTVGSCGTLGAAWDVHVSGNLAYVAEYSPGSSGVRVIDVSNPASPFVVGSWDTENMAFAVYVSGNHVYVADAYAGFKVISKFVPCPDVTWLSETEITATVPAGFVPGTYNLHVTNADGGQGTMYNAFTVIGRPTAAFTADVTSGIKPLTVCFTDQSTGSITSWSWDFGDGGTSTQQNPSHTYSDAGDFTVSLTVTGPGGSDTEVKQDYIHVTESLCECNLVPDTPTVHRGEPLGFQATVTNNTDNAGKVYFATKVTLPSLQKTRYIDGPVKVPLGPSQAKSGHISHTVPLSAETGTYTYHGYVGTYGLGLIHECQFVFTVE